MKTQNAKWETRFAKRQRREYRWVRSRERMKTTISQLHDPVRYHRHVLLHCMGHVPDLATAHREFSTSLAVRVKYWISQTVWSIPFSTTGLNVILNAQVNAIVYAVNNPEVRHRLCYFYEVCSDPKRSADRCSSSIEDCWYPCSIQKAWSNRFHSSI